MPAVTRSQSKKKEVQVVQAKKKIIRLIKNGKQETQVNSCSSDKEKFVKVIKDRLQKSEKEAYLSTHYNRLAASYPEGPTKNIITEERKKHYYNNVRIVTEIYYLIVDWFDKVFVVNGTIASPSFQTLLNVTFNKAAEIERDIKNAPPNPTPEEKHIIKTFLDQIQETRRIITPYVSSQEKATEVKVAAQVGPQVAAVPQEVKPRRSARLMAIKKN